MDKEKELYVCVNALQKCKILCVFSPSLWIDLVFPWMALYSIDFHSSGLISIPVDWTSIPLDWPSIPVDWLLFLWIDLHSCGFLSYSCGIHWNRPIPAGICGAPKSTVPLLDYRYAPLSGLSLYNKLNTFEFPANTACSTHTCWIQRYITQHRVVTWSSMLDSDVINWSPHQTWIRVTSIYASNAHFICEYMLLLATL